MDEARERSAADGAPTRVIHDREGQTWIVREFVRERSGVEDRSLLFDCGMAIRRVRDFPAEWHSLSEEELVALSLRH